MDDPIIDPPAGIPMLWNAEAIQQSITEHYIGNFATSGYLVEAMLSDARISHAVNSRTKGVLKKKAYYTPNKRARDKKLAKYIADEMQEMHDDIFPQDILEQLWAFTPMMGWSLFNMVWEVQEEMTLPTFRFWHPAFTFFLMSGNLDERKLQAITMGGGSVNRTGANIPIICGDPEWFHFAPYGEYRGWIRGAVRQVGIPWLVRNLSLRDWSRLSEVHGIPQRIVKVPANALEEDKARIFQKLIRLASEAVFVLPVAEDGTGFGVELLEPKTADSYKVMEMLGHRCDSDIMLALKGTQLMSGLGDQKGGSSSMAASKTVKSEDEDYSVGDAVKITQALRKQVFPFIVNYNYEDAQDCIPQLLLSDEPPQDKSMNAKTWLDVSQAMLNFQELGAEVDLDEVKEEFEIPFKSNKLNPPEQPEPNVPGAEPSEEEVVQRLTELKMEQEQVESEELRKTMTLQTVLISKDDYSLDEAKKWLTDHEYKTDVDEKEDTLRFRQRDPGDFIPASFRTVNIEKGISFVLGKLKPSNEESHSAHGRRRAKHSDHQQWVDKLVESSMGHGVTAMTPHLKKLKKAIEEANSYDDLRRSLKRIAREVQRGSLEKLITNSRLMSHVAGRAAQQDDGE
jgi:phage gp29-like protein